MSDEYKIVVNGRFGFNKTKVDVDQLNILSKSYSNYHLLHNNQSINAEIIRSDINSKYVEVKIDDKLFKINIYSELDKRIDEMGFSLGSQSDLQSIQAPMPGLILEIKVQKGQEVKENEPLLILEAMKMENIILSPRDGIIKSIEVKNGASVNKNELLIEFES